MNFLPEILWGLLVGNTDEPKRIAAGVGVIVLPIIGALAFFSGASPHATQLSVVVAIGHLLLSLC